MREGQSHSLILVPVTLSRILERMGYFGMRSILVLYLIRGPLGFTEEHATSFYGTLSTIIIFFPILGGLLGDLLIGSRISSLVGLGLQALGCFLLAVPDIIGLYSGALLLAFGAGLYSPNILSTLRYAYLGKEKIMDSAIFIFYVCVNIGAFLGSLLIPLLTDRFNYSVGFIFAGVIQLASLIVLLAFLPVMKEIPFRPNIYLEEKKENQLKTEWRIISLLFIFIFIPVFWALWETGNSMVYELLYKSAGDSSVASIANWINPVITVVVGIVLSIVWSFVSVSSFLKMTIGFLIFAISAILLSLIPAEGTSTIMVFIITSFALQAVAELFIAPIALSFVCRHSPLKFNSTLIGLNLSLTYLVASVASFLSVYSRQLSLNITALIIGIASIIIGVLFFVMYLLMRKDPAN